MDTSTRLRTVQWILVAAWIALFAGLSEMHLHSGDENRKTGWSCAAGFFTALVHGMWISLDFRIFNRRVGGWRFGAFFLGPLVIWIYLVGAYRMRALWMIPLSLLIYLAPVALVMVAEALRTGLATT